MHAKEEIILGRDLSTVENRKKKGLFFSELYIWNNDTATFMGHRFSLLLLRLKRFRSLL